MASDRLPANRKYDWETVEGEYIHGTLDPETGRREWLNMRQLADLHEVPYNKLRDRKSSAKSNGSDWDTDRGLNQARYTKVHAEERAASLISEIMEFDGKVMHSAKVGVMLIQARLNEIAEMLKYDRKIKGTGAVVPYTSIASDWMDTSELNQLTKTLSTLQDVGRKTLLDATEFVGAGGQADPTGAIDVREELAYAPDERLARTLEVLGEAGLITLGESEDRGPGATDPETA